MLADSHEYGGDDEGEERDDNETGSDGGSSIGNDKEEVTAGESAGNHLQSNENEDSSKTVESAPEYNPMIVRRSQRAIKPTKDIDLYLLGAKYGVDLEGSGADSSDLEFAPEAVSDGKRWLA